MPWRCRGPVTVISVGKMGAGSLNSEGNGDRPDRLSPLPWRCRELDGGPVTVISVGRTAVIGGCCHAVSPGAAVTSEGGVGLGSAASSWPKSEDLMT